MYDIRLASRDEAGSIAAVSGQCFSAPWDEDAVLKDMASEQSFVLSAVSDGVVAGYAICYFAGDQGDLVSIAVLPDHRRSGLGGSLLEKLEAVAGEHGVGAVFLEVRISNEPAVSLYEKYGYSRIGVRKSYYSDTGEDAILMRKDIHA